MSDYPQRNKNHLENKQNRLYGIPVKEGAGTPTLLFYYSNNTAKIDVWSNLEGDKDKGRNSLFFDEVVASDFLATLDKVIKRGGTDYSISVDVFKKKWDQGAKAFGKEPKLEARICVGRDKEGRIFISLLSWDKQKAIIPFFFGITDFRKFTAKGITMSDAEVSELAATGFLMYHLHHRSPVEFDEYTHDDGKKKDNGNNGGGGNNNYRNNNAPKQEASYDDDDLPF